MFMKKYGICYRPIFTDIESGKVERKKWFLYRKYERLEDVFNALTDFKKETFYSASYKKETFYSASYIKGLPHKTMYIQYKAVELDENEEWVDINKNM
jgi:hypothetical protein